MYRILRTIHLYSALTLLVFIIMYFTTGIIMIHPGWMENPDPKETMIYEALPPDRPSDAIELQEYLMAHYRLPGQPSNPEELSSGRVRFRWFRPGEHYEAVVNAGRDSVRIVQKEEYLRRTLAGFHRLHGYHGHLLYIIWALFLDLASVAMIMFAATGIYMWYKLTTKRVLGWLLLGSSWGFAAVIVLYLLYSP